MPKVNPSPNVRKPPGRNPLVGLLSVAQVAEQHNIPQATVYRAIQEGRLAAWHQGFTYLVPAAEADQWTPRRRAASGAANDR
jgi:excisionase family DNA binding protein